MMQERYFVPEADRYRAHIQILPSTKETMTLLGLVTAGCHARGTRVTSIVVEVEKRSQGVGQGARAAVDILFAASPTIAALIHVHI